MNFFNFLKNMFTSSKKVTSPTITLKDIEVPEVKPIEMEPPVPEIKSNTMDFLTASKVRSILKNVNYLEWHELLIEFLPKYEVNTINRVSEFLAQTTHESINYTALEENLNYSASRLVLVFPKYFNEKNVIKYARNKKLIGNRVYANRMGNGKEESGDGFKFRGRGLIQLTGKNNYLNFGKSINKTLEETVTYLTTKEGALVSALWFWKKNNLNAIADSGNHQLLCKKINGGTNGLSDRINRYNKFKEILSS